MSKKHQIYKRPICGTLHRKSGNSTEVISKRFFANLNSALSKGVNLILLEAEPGDVFELSSSNYGYLIATLVVKVGSKGLSSMKIEFHIYPDDPASLYKKNNIL